MAKKYTKTLTLNMAGGTTKEFTDTEAVAILRRLDDNPFIFSIADGATVTYYMLNTTAGAFVEIASYTTSYEEVAGTACENELPNCPTPVTPSIELNKSTETVEVDGTVTLTATTAPEAYAVTWTSSDTTKATVAGGVVTGVAAGDATITAKITVGGVDYTASATVTVTGS